MGYSRRLRVKVAGGLIAAATAVSACGAPATLQVSDIERSLVAGFGAQVGGTFTATCPPDVLAQRGVTVRCTVTDDGDGTIVLVEVVQVDDAGGFTWRAVGIDE